MGEYTKEQQKQESRVIANGGGGSRQLKGADDILAYNTIQRTLIFDSGTDYLKKENVDLPAFKKVQAKAEENYSGSRKLFFKEETSNTGVAAFAPERTQKESGSLEGTIKIQAIKSEDKTSKSSTAYHDKLIEVSHETNHAIDYASTDKNVKYLSDGKKKIISEINSFATQSAITTQIGEKSGTFSSRFTEEESIFKERNAIISVKLQSIIESYLVLYEVPGTALDFIKENSLNITHAQVLYDNLLK